jgi:leader peptidase (prepilin peptidase) / N-methyltransferase
VQAVTVVAVALLGLLTAGSANLAIDRWPRHEPLALRAPLPCQSCGTPLPRPLGVPGGPWLAARGRCRACGTAVSRERLVVEVAMTTLFATTAAVWGFDPLLPALLVFAWSAVVATAIDLRHRIIPNALTLRLPLVLLPLLVLAAAVTGDWVDLRRAVLAGLSIPLAMFLMSEAFRLLRGQPGMGMGDVKYAISIGLVVGMLGAVELILFAYGSIFSAVVIAVVLLASGRGGVASRIPFGPYLVLGAQLAILARVPLARLVARLLGA